MLSLTYFDKRKLVGLVNLSHGEYEIAIKWFNRALKVEQDPQTFFFSAQAYAGLEQYEKARDYALNAIDNRYDAYGLFTKISIEKLKDLNKTLEVLKEGVQERNPSACLEMARLYAENNAFPDMLDPSEASLYIDRAFQYAAAEKKGIYAYKASRWYGFLYDRFPDYFDFNSRTEQLHYLNVFNEYGKPIEYCKGFNTEIFDVANKNDDYGVVQTLFDNFDGEACFIFSLMLLYEEYKKTGTITITNNQGFLTATEGAIKFNHGGCYALTAICFWSDFEGCCLNKEAANDSINNSKQYKYVIPKTFKEFFKELMNHLNNASEMC